MNSKQAKDFIKALDALVAEKGIDKKIVIEAMEAAMANAYKKNTGIPNVKATVDENTGKIRLFTYKTVVTEDPIIDEEGNEVIPVFDENTQIKLEDARKIVDDIEAGETIDTEVKIIPEEFGRVAVLSAKQIIVQKVKEAEKELVNQEFGDKQDEILIGTLSREDAKNYYVDLGRAHGVLPKDEIIILLSRSHYGFVKRLLENEIPELSDGTVILYSVARDAGNRSKIAVYTDYDKVDPVGAIIGEKGSRINRVLSQLNGEKIDVILYDKDPVKFIQNALSPAKDVEVRIVNEKNKEALAIVNDENSSLAIGKKGQNVKLASRLTKYKITIKKVGELDEE